MKMNIRIFWSMALLAAGSVLGSSEGVLDGLTFYQNFEQGQDATFAVGRNTASVYAMKGTPLPGQEIHIADGLYGKGLVVNSADDFSPVDYPIAGNFAYEKGTVSFWVKPLAVDRSVRYELICMVHYGVVLERGRLFFRTFSLATKSQNMAPSVPLLETEDWVHIAFSWDQRTMKKVLYFNGKLIDEIEFDEDVLNKMPPNASRPITIGAKYAYQKYGKSFPGVYDEVGIWNRMLTPEEIQTLYEKPLDSDVLIAKQEANKERSSGPLKIELGYQSHPNGLYYKGEALEVKIPVSNESGQELILPGKIVVQNFHEATVASYDAPLTLSKGAKGGIKKSFPIPNLFGSAKIRYTYEYQGREYGKDVVIFAVLSPEMTLTEKDLDSFYGIHTDCTEYELDVLQKLGISNIRGHDLVGQHRWLDIEKSQGDYDYSRFDAGFDLADKFNVGMMVCLEKTPGWAAREAGQDRGSDFLMSSPPSDWKMWEDFVRDIVIHSADRVKCWELWNEPDHDFFWRGSMAEYIELCKRAYPIIKANDPDAIVVGGGGLHWATLDGDSGEVIENNVMEYCDELSFHRYLKNLDEVMGNIDEVHEFKKLMNQFGEERPLSVTEGGVWSASFYRDLDLPELPPMKVRSPKQSEYRRAAAAMVKLLSIYQSEGVTQTYLYFMRGNKRMHSKWPSRAYYDFNLMEWGPEPEMHVPKPTLIAAAFHKLNVGDKTFYKRLQRDEKIWGFIYQGPTQSTALLWAEVPDGKTIPVQMDLLQETGSACDLMSNPVEGPLCLSTLPQYITVKGADAAGRLEAAFLSMQYDKASLGALAVEITDPVLTLLSSVKLFPFAPEIQGKDWLQIDLRPFCNASCADETAGDGKGGWVDADAGNCLLGIEYGLRKEYSVPINIIDPDQNGGKSVIALSSTSSGLGVDSVVISVNKKIRKLYFTHAATWLQTSLFGETGWDYVIRYASGRVEVVPVVQGEHVDDWRRVPMQNNHAAKPVIVTPTVSEMRGRPYRFIWIMDWKNDDVADGVVSIEIRTKNSKVIPLILAITAWTKD
ncbi:LamG-like jellyroll fold domain-containing protein [Pontiella sulfatireligans]|uniref:Beta-xylosidase n=1 Tax=Pontiella sulfatireligans TaxID=2750658 RepID=A0A6C2UKB0_9BACT|nr:LamG-like jellyroll fold domain-containing protein [Pontiella sulfatireligans]VGO20670.1 Beta-xylosidase [Pontiella sulfatireligans]